MGDRYHLLSDSYFTRTYRYFTPTALDLDLGKQTENTDRDDMQDHLEDARRKVADYRTEQQDDDS